MHRSIVTNNTFVAGYELGKLLVDGSTKQMYNLPAIPGHCLIFSKDRVKGWDSVKNKLLHDIVELSNAVNDQIFTLLNGVGVHTVYVKQCCRQAYIAKKCLMFPYKFITRRYAAGPAFLSRNPGVQEGERFSTLQQEIIEGNEIHSDRVWSDEAILAAEMNVLDVIIGNDELNFMRRTAFLVFEFLEKVWATRFCSLVDMKIEFGIDLDGKIIVGKMFDSDSFRLRPLHDKNLLIDRHINRRLINMDSNVLNLVRESFMWMHRHLTRIISAIPQAKQLVVILMSRCSDTIHCGKISAECEKLGLNTEIRLISEFEGPDDILCIMQEYESNISELVFVVVSSHMNCLEKVRAESLTSPVINCPPVKQYEIDAWSDLRCPTILLPKPAAAHAALILGSTNFMVWAKWRFIFLNRTNKEITIFREF